MSKKEPPPKTRNQLVAIASGSVAGMPDDFSRLIKRCDAALQSGVLSPEHAELVTEVRSTCEVLWPKIDALIKEGIGLPKKRDIELL